MGCEQDNSFRGGKRRMGSTLRFAILLCILQLPRCSFAEETGVFYSSFNLRDNVTVLTHGGVLKTAKSDSLMSCAQLCGRELLCRFATFDKDGHSCILLSQNGVDHEKLWMKKGGSIGLEKIGDSLQKGSRKELPVLNCKELLRINPQSSSGIYWIDPDAGFYDNAFRAYCDQETAGGGWTLVWSYQFTNYQKFNDVSNAVTPRPNWAVKRSDVTISTTPPLTETRYDATEFSLWKKIGSDVMIKSNINNWVTCTTGDGSLVGWVEGSVTCRLVKIVNHARSCPGVLPVKLRLDYYGPIFEASPTGYYYYFDGYTKDRWPTHNPCGRILPNHLTGVENPHGSVFIR